MLSFTQFLTESPEFDGVQLHHAGSGGNWHEWNIHHPKYGKLGSATLISHQHPLHKATTAKLDVGTEENENVPDHLRDGDTSEGPKYKLGAGHVKSLLHQIRQHVRSNYPNIRTLESDRTTGAKANKGSARIKIAEQAGTPEYGYHVTPARNVKSILKNGLTPKIGSRSRALGEKHKAVYLFKSKEHAHEGVMNWLGDHFHEDTPLSMLKVKIPHDTPRKSGADYEHVITGHIHPSHISLHTKEL